MLGIPELHTSKETYSKQFNCVVSFYVICNSCHICRCCCLFKRRKRKTIQRNKWLEPNRTWKNAYLFNCCLVILKKPNNKTQSKNLRNKHSFPRTPSETISCLCALIWFFCIHLLFFNSSVLKALRYCQIVVLLWPSTYGPMKWQKWTVSWAKLNLRSISSFLGSSNSVLDEDGCHKSVTWICSSVSKAIFFKNAEEKYRYTTILQNNKILRFILWHLCFFSSFASVLLVSQIVAVLRLSLASDMVEAGLTVDSCQNAGATNEWKVFPVSSWFENLLLFCLQWKLQYSRNYKSVCAKNTNVCIIWLLVMVTRLNYLQKSSTEQILNLVKVE